MIAIPNICGPIVLLNYTAEFSTHSKLLSPVEPTLLVAVIPLGATLITIFLIDLVGRKLLLVGSLIGTAVGFFFIFVHQLLIDRFPHTEWIQFSVLLLTILMACIGILPVSHVYKMDILPPKVRHTIFRYLWKYVVFQQTRTSHIRIRSLKNVNNLYQRRLLT